MSFGAIAGALAGASIGKGRPPGPSGAVAGAQAGAAPPPPASNPSAGGGAAAGAGAGASAGSGGGHAAPAGPPPVPPALTALLRQGPLQAAKLWDQATTIVGLSAKWGLNAHDLLGQVANPGPGLDTAVQYALNHPGIVQASSESKAGASLDPTNGKIPAVQGSAAGALTGALTGPLPLQAATPSPPQKAPTPWPGQAGGSLGSPGGMLGRFVSKLAPLAAGVPTPSVLDAVLHGSAPRPIPGQDFAYPGHPHSGSPAGVHNASSSTSPQDSVVGAIRSAQAGALPQSGAGGKQATSVAPYSPGQINNLVAGIAKKAGAAGSVGGAIQAGAAGQQAPTPAAAPPALPLGLGAPNPGAVTPTTKTQALAGVLGGALNSQSQNVYGGLVGAAPDSLQMKGDQLAAANTAGRIVQAAQKGVSPGAQGGIGQITNTAGLTVKGSAMDATQQHWANQIIQIGRQLHAAPLAIQAALYAAAHESDLGANQTAMTSANSQGYGGLMQGNHSWVLPNGQYDHAGQIRAFFNGGNGFEQGGANNLVKQGLTNPAEIAIKVEVPSIWPLNAYGNQYPVAQGLAEAAKTLHAAGGGGGAPGQQQSPIAQILGGKQAGAPAQQPSYVNPIPGATIGRTDMGVDANMPAGAKIVALGDSVFKGTNANWYSGQPYLSFQLTNGPQAGKYWYIAEAINPVNLTPGQTVKAGQQIGTYNPGGTGLELGWGTATPGQTASAASGSANVPNHSNTPEGQSFHNFLTQLTNTPSNPSVSGPSGSTGSTTGSSGASAPSGSTTAAPSSGGATASTPGATPAQNALLSSILGTSSSTSTVNPVLSYYLKNTAPSIWSVGGGSGASGGNPFAISLAHASLQDLAGVHTKISDPLTSSSSKKLGLLK